MNFVFNNIKFKKHDTENWLMATGEITNNSGKNYNAVVFRLVVFIKSIPIANLTLTINGFLANQTKDFELQVEELEYKILPEISRYDFYAESAY